MGLSQKLLLLMFSREHERKAIFRVADNRVKNAGCHKILFDSRERGITKILEFVSQFFFAIYKRRFDEDFQRLYIQNFPPYTR